jgi:hypothetical protein
MIAGILRVGGGGGEVANYRRAVHFQGLLWDQLKHMQPLAPASPQPLHSLLFCFKGSTQFAKTLRLNRIERNGGNQFCKLI